MGDTANTLEQLEVRCLSASDDAPRNTRLQTSWPSSQTWPCESKQSTRMSWQHKQGMHDLTAFDPLPQLLVAVEGAARALPQQPSEHTPEQPTVRIHMMCTDTSRAEVTASK